MRFESQSFWLPKDEEYPAQYQDAFAVDAQRGMAAIADGVSSTIFSGPWAQILVRTTVADPPPWEDATAFHAWLAGQRTAWSSQIDASQLTWYQRPKMAEGAMSTLLWVTLSPVSGGEGAEAGAYRLRAFSVGDCSLFHVRRGQVLRAFPLECSDAFTLNPSVVGSIDRKHERLPAFKVYEAECRPGDLLVLCTDAIGLWATKRQEAGAPVTWEDYWGMSPEAWHDEILTLRQQSLMRYDDSTLVLLRVVPETAPMIGVPAPANAAGPAATAEWLPWWPGYLAKAARGPARQSRWSRSKKTLRDYFSM
jgi:hypothetical protein